MIAGNARTLCLVAGFTACLAGALAQSLQESVAKQRCASPPLSIAILEGKPVNIQQMKGQVVLLDFMTTTCPTCKRASSGLETLYQEMGAKGFRPVAIALDTGSVDTLRAYRQEHRLTFAIGTAPREDVGRYLSHPADKPLMVPTLVLLDRRGKVCSVEVGWKGEDALRASVLRLLAE